MLTDLYPDAAAGARSAPRGNPRSQASARKSGRLTSERPVRSANEPDMVLGIAHQGVGAATPRRAPVDVDAERPRPVMEGRDRRQWFDARLPSR